MFCNEPLYIVFLAGMFCAGLHDALTRRPVSPVSPTNVELGLFPGKKVLFFFIILLLLLFYGLKLHANGLTKKMALNLRLTDLLNHNR